MRYLTVAWLVLLFGSPTLLAQKFYPDDPLRRDEDSLDVAVEPAELELSDLYDRFGHIFHDFGASPIGTEAKNVNTLDEVPDSSWFTNRHGTRRMSVEALIRGPNTGKGPDPNETWTVFRSKTQGLTPGFQILDEKGDRYVIKLDPVDVPELASAAEVIATKVFYALGYNTPENYIVRVHPDRFVVQPGTKTEDRFGDEIPLTEWRFRRSIRRVPRLDDGTMRVLASKYLPGRPLGPFRYYETRTDDPNDVIRHEDRRELRGLRLFAAWLNHDDTRAHNTQDAYVETSGRRYIRHYLMDFGSAFGSGSVDIQYAHLTNQYWLDLRQVKRNVKGFGLLYPEYRDIRWPKFPAFAAVGRWTDDHFDPESWRNDYPNPAFVRMTARDAFWASRILMRFTRKELQAIVAAGEYSNPAHARYFLEVLVSRQQTCGRLGINALNPLDEIRVRGNALELTNLSEKYGFTEPKTHYRVSWSSYDNDTGETRELVEPAVLSETRFELPRNVAKELYLVATIQSLNDAYPHWERPVTVYLRPKGGSYEVVGIERENPEKSTFPMS